MVNLTLNSTFTINDTQYKVTNVTEDTVTLTIIPPGVPIESITPDPSDIRLFKSICGVGYIGIGPHVQRDKNGKFTKAYRTWYTMMRNVYGNESDGTLSVCEKWHNFQNYADWYAINGVEQPQWTMTRTVKSLTNTNYGPEHCIFVPRPIAMHRVSLALHNGLGDRYKQITFLKRKNVFRAKLVINGRLINVGDFSSREDAVIAITQTVNDQLLNCLEDNRSYMTECNYTLVKTWYTSV